MDVIDKEDEDVIMNVIKNHITITVEKFQLVFMVYQTAYGDCYYEFGLDGCFQDILIGQSSDISNGSKYCRNIPGDSSDKGEQLENGESIVSGFDIIESLFNVSSQVLLSEFCA
ncbi:MAG: hypothetical protein EZS28_047157 [Streblomastix strix]|uniref:Uncharacterized protein n=1 Tax=Streblomastix strix TaxID=222440 RepID=A0A5J4TFP7_9EUKA|nr:MAG: hypothetical protein EZS28_047157 [Streblomastix strix]